MENEERIRDYFEKIICCRFCLEKSLYLFKAIKFYLNQNYKTFFFFFWTF